MVSAPWPARRARSGSRTEVVCCQLDSVNTVTFVAHSSLSPASGLMRTPFAGFPFTSGSSTTRALLKKLGWS
eukprot:2711206-Lingulodinium_polyedra.AAC.1